MKRRHLLLLLGALTAPAAMAQEQTPAAGGAPQPSPRPRPRRPARRAAAKPQALPAQKAAPVPPNPESQAPQLEAAPVPNRDLEAPRVAEKDQTRLSPSVIHRRLPKEGMATEGAPNEREERLFFPAPGARLSVPFAY